MFVKSLIYHFYRSRLFATAVGIAEAIALTTVFFVVNRTTGEKVLQLVRLPRKSLPPIPFVFTNIR